jgi:tRNA-splicing ligase RtcB
MQVFNDGRIKAWTDGVPFEQSARDQVERLSNMPFIHKHVAVMPDVHAGIGATVGSVIATTGAIIPAAVGVDIGCGMVAVKTSLTASDLPDNLSALRSAVEAAVPHGRTDNGGRNDRGAWGTPPSEVLSAWENLETGFKSMCHFYPKLEKCNTVSHLGTLGTGNHFIEVCLDESQSVWVMLHSGSRGVGGRIGSHFISLAKEDMKRWFINLPDQDLAYLPEGSEHYNAYRAAVRWAQQFAYLSRGIMLDRVVDAMEKSLGILFHRGIEAINCHHNYVSEERHFGADVLVTRKGAVSAKEGELGIIPGSMGAKSFIVRGKGNAQSFHSCSHGAGRVMSRTEAKKRFTIEDHEKATAGVECRKDAEVLDETPAAYKDVDSVMAAQSDLVEVVHTLKQVLCVKG